LDQNSVFAEIPTLPKVDQKYLEILTCGVVEGWRSVGPVVLKMKYYIQFMTRGIS
jgi:hypothetical protein